MGKKILLFTFLSSLFPYFPRCISPTISNNLPQGLMFQSILIILFHVRRLAQRGIPEHRCLFSSTKLSTSQPKRKEAAGSETEQLSLSTEKRQQAHREALRWSSRIFYYHSFTFLCITETSGLRREPWHEVEMYLSSMLQPHLFAVTGSIFTRNWKSFLINKWILGAAWLKLFFIGVAWPFSRLLRIEWLLLINAEFLPLCASVNQALAAWF